MREKKDEQNQQDDLTEKFTGSPEQKFPDLEAEDKQTRQEEQFEKETDTVKKKD